MLTWREVNARHRFFCNNFLKLFHFLSTKASHLRIHPRICIHIAISIGICICLDLQHHSHLHQEQLLLFPIFLVVNSTAGQGHRIAESIKELSPERESQSSQVCSSLAM